MSKPSLKTPSNPFHAPDPAASPHTRQASLNIARSPHLSPASSYIPNIPSHTSPNLRPSGHSRKSSYAPANGFDRTSEETIRPLDGGYGNLPRQKNSEDDGEEEAEDAEGLERDLEAFDLMLDDHSHGRGRDVDEEEGVEVRYEGPFQPPVGREMVGLLASFVGVLVLAVAAGFTTVVIDLGDVVMLKSFLTLTVPARGRVGVSAGFQGLQSGSG